MMIFLTIIAVLILIFSIANFLLLLFLGGGVANIAEVLMKTMDDNTEDLLTKFHDLDSDIRSRLPPRPYGMAEEEPYLTEGPEDMRIPNIP